MVEKNIILTQASRGKPRPLDLDPSIYRSNNYVVLDFETTNKDHGSPVCRDNALVLACWYSGAQCGATQEPRIHSVFGSEFEQQELAEAISHADFIIAYHAKFECGWLKRCGVELRDLIVYDPMLGEFCLAGNLKLVGGLSLDATLKRYSIAGKMRYVSALIESGVCPSRIAQTDLKAYCICDVRRTHDLFLRQRERIFDSGLEKVLYGRCLQTPMLADLETRGVDLSPERVRALSKDVLRDYGRSTEELGGFCGAVNWDSPKQVAGLLYDKLGFEEARDYRGKPIRTDTGARSASVDTIGLLKPTSTSQVRFKKLWDVLAPLKKQVLILEKMRGICDEDGGHFWATYNQAIAGNHRLTSTGGKWGLQLQNQPRSFKKLFCSGRKGCKLAEGDSPQLEFRTAIDLTGDPIGLADVLARADVHSLTSSVTGLPRPEAKPHTFKPVYGGKSGPPRLRRYYRAFNERYRVMYDGQMGWVYRVLEDKQLTIATGLTFYWPDIEVTPSGFITFTPQIFNYPVSSLATADIAQLSLLLVWHGIAGWGSYICNTVHDAGVADVPEEEACKFEELMVQSYTQDIYDVLHKLYGYSFHTPLGLGYKYGDFWGEGEERKYEPDKRFKFTSDVATKIELRQ